MVRARGRGLGILVLLLALACTPAPPGSPQLLAGPAVPAAVAAAVPALDLEAPLSAVAGDVAVWVALPGRPDPLYARSADEPMLAASLYKLALLLEVERRVDARQLAYDDEIEITDEDVTADGSNVLPGTALSIDAALEQMITYSDNGTAMALWRTLGRSANATLDRVGIAGMHVAVDRDDDHTVTARALGTWFSMLAQRALVSSAASTRMYDRLTRQHINDRLPRSLPGGTRVAHKTGDLIDHIHDGGIVETRAGPLVVVVLTRGVSDGEARSLIADVAARAYAHVTRAVAERAPTDAPAVALPAPLAPVRDAGEWTGVAVGVGALALACYVLFRIRGSGRGPRGPRPRSMAVRGRRR